MYNLNEQEIKELINVIENHKGEIVFIKYHNGGVKENINYTYGVITGVEKNTHLKCAIASGENSLCYTLIHLSTIEYIAASHDWYRKDEPNFLYGYDHNFEESKKR